MQAGKRHPRPVGRKAAAEQLLRINSIQQVAVGSLHVLAAALQDARVVMVQHEAQGCPREGSVHMRSLVCGGWLQEDGDHV